MRYSITEEQLVHQLLNREAAEGGSRAAGKADQELSRLGSRLRLLSCLVRARPSNPSLLSQPAPTPALLLLLPPHKTPKTVERPENTNEQRRSERRSDQRVTWHRESSTTAAMVEMVEMVVDMALTFRVLVLGAGVGGITRVNEG